jgi:hypothetical protein
MHFYNTETQEYPRYQGDLELLGWVFGTPLPENWVEVAETPTPEFSWDETLEYGEPTQTPDGNWETNWVVRKLTQEELLERQKTRVRNKVLALQSLTEEEAALLVG